MPYNPDGSFTLNQSFGTGTAPDNQFPPAVGNTLDDIAAGIDINNIISSTVFTGTALLRANNLSDVFSPTSALANLDPQLTSKIRMNIVTANYTFATTDAEKCILIQTNSGRTLTVPAFSVVALGQGTAITIASFGSGSWFLQPAGGVTLTWSPSLGAGNRTLAIGAAATLLALFDDYWIVTGVGIS